MTLGPLQTKWVEALESGRYQQGQTRLRVGDSYCCLGVLAEHTSVTVFDEIEHYL